MSDIVIKAESLGKKYTIGHQAQRSRDTTFREVIVQNARNLWHKTRDLATGKPIIQGESLEEVWALKDVNFEIRRGEAVGIIGRNGAGKSTLLKILSRITEPTEGRVTIKGRVASLLEVGTGFHSELTGRENIYLNGAILGMTRAEIKRKFDEIVAFAEVEKYLDTPVKRYSSGMYVRLAFAVAAHLEPEILLVDEVLAVGDAEFQKKCLGKMSGVVSEGRTVLFVSHNMTAIQYFCNSAILIKMGRIEYLGSASETVKQYGQDILRNRQGSLPAHVLYDLGGHDKKKQLDFAITRVEIIDQDGRPKEDVSTLDTVVFRIYCWARYRVQMGSVVLQISTPYGVSLLLSSTQPDSTVPISFKEGKTIVECEFEALPLAAGEYVVGGGMAIPNKEWLCKEDYLGLLSVSPKDVYRSGMAPAAPRSLLVTPHTWRLI